MSRRMTLTPEKQEKILTTIRNGGLLETAAQSANVPVSTFWDWMRRGEEALAKQEEDPDYEMTSNEVAYSALSEAVTRARADVETLAIGTILRAGTTGITYKIVETRTRTVKDKDGKESKEEYEHERTILLPPDPKNLQWYLEHSMWRKYGRRNAVELTGEDGGPIQVTTITTPTDIDAYRALKAAMEESGLPLLEIEAVEEETVDAEEA